MHGRRRPTEDNICVSVDVMESLDILEVFTENEQRSITGSSCYDYLTSRTYTMSDCMDVISQCSPQAVTPVSDFTDVELRSPRCYTDLDASPVSSNDSGLDSSSPSSECSSLDDSYEMPLKVVGDQVLVKIGNNWYDLDPSKSEHETHTEPTDSDTISVSRLEDEYRDLDSRVKAQKAEPNAHVNLQQISDCIRQLKKRCITKDRKRSERLWEFLLRLLGSNDTNPSLIEWVDKETGMFRLNQSKVISHMWGSRKNNLHMTYEKFSRAMRYYYRRKILQPVYGKKLVYKFGPNSSGW